ncbi:MAG: double zinc ribbon domain-containing protein [Burkholderiales bacterium]
MSNPALTFLNNCSKFGQNLFGTDCLLCGARSGSENICPACLAHLPYLQRNRCRICANPTTAGPICGTCIAKPPHFSRTLAVFSYDFPVDALIQSLKYRENLALSSTFAQMLMQASSSYPRPDFIVPVPLHPSRLRERGFNQAMEIARNISGKAGIALKECSKIRDTPSQTSLPWAARKRNVRGAFSCESDLKSGHVAIIDDVMTTGSTLDELAKTLLRQGAREVSAWVVARAVKSV